MGHVELQVYIYARMFPSFFTYLYTVLEVYSFILLVPNPPKTALLIVFSFSEGKEESEEYTLLPLRPPSPPPKTALLILFSFSEGKEGSEEYTLLPLRAPVPPSQNRPPHPFFLH
jgi:hypothetical protein